MFEDVKRKQSLKLGPAPNRFASRPSTGAFASLRPRQISPTLSPPEQRFAIRNLQPATWARLVAKQHSIDSKEKTMLKKRMHAVLLVVSLMLMCKVSVLAQASSESAAQSASNADAQGNGITDKDIQMLREDLRAQRKDVMAQNMTLTADEATKFWPIFDEYRKEAIKPNDERWALIKDYAANYSTMTDAQANDYVQRATAVDQQLLALRLKYVPMFEKVISAKKTALWYQIDRRIDLLINLQLSTQIPMVDTTK
jgi:Spy/CpxP family protein refolding chaperone